MSHCRSINPIVLAYLPKDLEKLLILDCGIGQGAWAFRIRTDPRFRGRPFIVGLDLHEPHVLKQRRLGLYDELHHCDVLEIPYSDNLFDIVIAAELIEHLPKKDGPRMMDEVERVSNGLVIITTPKGFQGQEPYGGNVHQKHLSGWEPAEFTSRGYSVKVVDKRIMTRTILLADNVRRWIFHLRPTPETIVAVKVVTK